jgi:nucleotide-binding universal stress UspA family protein
MNILIAADGSPYTKHMLAHLAAHDEWMSPSHSYTVLTVVMELPPRAVAALDKAVVKSYYDDEAERVLMPIRTFFARHGIAATFVFKVGHAAEVVAGQAQAGKFDLLVMGTHGHGNLTNLVLGSVVNKVLAHCKTPLLLVR